MSNDPAFERVTCLLCHLSGNADRTQCTPDALGPLSAREQQKAS